MKYVIILGEVGKAPFSNHTETKFWNTPNGWQLLSDAATTYATKEMAWEAALNLSIGDPDRFAAAIRSDTVPPWL